MANNKGDYNLINVFQTAKGFFAVIEGRLTRDATLSKNKKDEDVVSVGVATGEKTNHNRYVSSICRKAGMQLSDGVEIENFVNCTIKGNLGEAFSKEGKKGNHVIMAGNVSVFNDGVFMFPELVVLTQWIPGEDGKDHPENKIFGNPSVFTHVYGDKQEVFCVLPGVIEYISDIKSSTHGSSGYVYANVSSDASVEKLYDIGVNAYNKEKEYSTPNFVVFNNNMVRRNEEGKLEDTGENRLKNRAKKGTKVLFIGSLRRSENQEEGTVSYKISARNFAILSGGVLGKKADGAANTPKPQAEPDVPAPSEDSDGFDPSADEEELPF